MKMRFPMLASLLAILAASPVVAADALREQAKGLFEAIPLTPPALPGETATPEKLALGKALYFDPRISENQDVSCSSCHNLSMSGVEGLSSSVGYHGQLGGRKAPTVLNAVFNKSQFWDGRASGLKEQVIGSVMAFPAAAFKTRGGPMIPSPAATAATKLHVVEQLKSLPGYVEAFKKAFPEEAEPVAYDNIARAIAVFEATLITPGAPFDRWLMGDDTALSDAQKQGLKLFVDKGCSTCHNGVNIGGGSFAKFGVAQNPPADYLPSDDLGRFAVTHAVADKYVFKVASLRNVELTGPYFHSGATWDLKQAVNVMSEAQLGQKLSDDEAGNIVAFLKSLNGKQPQIALPALPQRGAP
jgi:cytochrome c peroxidase